MTRYERFPLLLLKCHMLIEDIPKGMHFIIFFPKQRKSQKARTFCEAQPECYLICELQSRMPVMTSHNHEIFMTPWERY